MSTKKIVRLSQVPEGFGLSPDALEADMFASDMPVQHTHSYYEDDELGLYIGVWDTTDMLETPGPYACDEFMWVLEGELGIKNSKTGAVETVQAGEAFVIPKGYDCQWRQRGYLRKFYVISEHPEESIPTAPAVEGIVKLPANSTQGSSVCYEDSLGRFTAGSWQYDSLLIDMAATATNQFVYVRDGVLQLDGEQGEQHTFEAGDAFFVPRGTVCRWHSETGVSAYYTTVKSAEE